DFARAAVDAVRQRRVSLDTLALPIHLTLSKFADPKLSRDPAVAVLKLVRETFALGPRFLGWMTERLRSGTTWLLLDSLDEVPDGHRKELTQRLHLIATQGWQTRLLLTCRTANWLRELIPWSELTEYELAPFNPLEIRQFVGRWFSRDAAAGVRPD